MSLAIYNQQLKQLPNQDCTTSLLDKLATIRNPPKRHILTPHPYTQIINTNVNIINAPNTIHIELYNFVQQNEQIIIQKLIDKFPFLPIRLLNEAMNNNNSILDYSHPPIPNAPLTKAQEIHTTCHHMYIIIWNASTLHTAQPTISEQNTNHQQHTQQVEIYHKQHTHPTNSHKPKTFEKKSHNAHQTKTLITNIPTIKPIQTNLTTLIGARPTGLAHKKEIKHINIYHLKRKKLISPNTSHTNYPNPNPPLTTNPHNISNNHKTRKVIYIPKNIHKLSSLHAHHIHCNKETPPPIKVKAKYYKHKKLKTTHKKHMVHLLLLRCGDIESNQGPHAEYLNKTPTHT